MDLAEQQAAGYTNRDTARALYRRFFQRSQRFRATGAGVGLAAGLTVILILAAERGDAGFEIPLADALVFGLAGSLSGSILAEAFRIRRPAGPRTASLDVRSTERYEDAESRRHEFAVAVAGLAATVVAVATWTTVVPVVALLVAIAALAGLRRWATQRVILRPRPDLPAEVIQMDDDIRRLAVRAGLSRPIVILATLAVSRQWALLGAAHGWAVFDIAGFALFVVACVWWVQNWNFGIRVPRIRAQRRSLRR